MTGQNTHDLDVPKVGPWMIYSRTGLDHGRHHAWVWEGGNNLT